MTLNKVKILFYIAFLVVLVHFVYVISVYSSLPETIAIHFDTLGNPDGYGNKKYALVIPIINLLLVLLARASAINPRFANILRVNKLSDEEFTKNRNFLAVMSVCMAIVIFVSQFSMRL